MNTRVRSINPERPDPQAIAAAAEVLHLSGLVAFPTETVYGLGANALNPLAVRRIFEAKGRPPNNPLIVHVCDTASAAALTALWPEAASQLADRFWPGPLTLVLPKAEWVPPEVTAGGPTIALRLPAHPVALALLRACQLPLAAPSANLSGELSPTRAEHVLRGLDGRIDLLLDAGPTTGGLESTVLDLLTSPPKLLRPGLVTVQQIEEVIGAIERSSYPSDLNMKEPLPGPGMLARHYAPRTHLEIVEGNSWPRVQTLLDQGLRVGWLTFVRGDGEGGDRNNLVIRRLPREAAHYAAGLYATLHDLDAAHLERIVVEMPPPTEEWRAARDRLARAACPVSP